METLFKGILVRTAEPMKHHTSFRVGGPARIMVMPETRDEVFRVLEICRAEDLDVTVLGAGTNILVNDAGLKGVVINLCHLKQTTSIIELDSERVRLDVPAGATLASVLRRCMQEGLEGAEFAAGIPGTIGGAVMMNAGASSGTISDILDSIEVTDDRTGTTQTARKDLDFSYRRLAGMNGIVTGVSLKLLKGDRKAVKKRIYLNYMKKKSTQPLLQKSAGCFFKNPAFKKTAGELIDLCNLKGKRIGDAVVSNLHANFILNAKDATCTDIVRLGDMVKNEVFKTFSVELQPEVIIKNE